MQITHKLCTPARHQFLPPAFNEPCNIPPARSLTLLLAALLLLPALLLPALLLLLLLSLVLLAAAM